MNRPMTCRKRRNDVKTERVSLARDRSSGLPVYWLDGVRHEGGVNLAQALMRNWGTCAPMPRERRKWKHHEHLSTDAEHRGGVTRSSEDGP